MKKEEFIKVIESMDKIDKFIDDLYKMNVDVTNSSILEYGVISDILWRNIYGQEGLDWINWWLYERDRNKPTEIQCWSEDGTPISINTVEELYYFVESNYNKNESDR